MSGIFLPALKCYTLLILNIFSGEPMARLLIMNAIRSEGATAYHVNDVVVVMPDSHVWGGQEGLPVFKQVDVVGTASEWAHMLEDETDANGLVIQRRVKTFKEFDSPQWAFK